MTVLRITWLTSNFLPPVACVALPSEGLQISTYQGHALLAGTKMNCVLAPFPVVGPLPVPSSLSTLTEVDKAKDLYDPVHEVTTFNA